MCTTAQLAEGGVGNTTFLSQAIPKLPISLPFPKTFLGASRTPCCEPCLAVVDSPPSSSHRDRPEGAIANNNDSSTSEHYACRRFEVNAYDPLYDTCQPFMTRDPLRQDPRKPAPGERAGGEEGYPHATPCIQVGRETDSWFLHPDTSASSSQTDTGSNQHNDHATGDEATNPSASLHTQHGRTVSPPSSDGIFGK